MIDRYIYNMLDNVLSPLVKDINEILERSLRVGISKDTLMEVIKDVINLEKFRITTGFYKFLIAITLGVLLWICTILV